MIGRKEGAVVCGKIEVSCGARERSLHGHVGCVCVAAQLNVAGVVPDLWIAVVGSEIQKVRIHCSNAFCSVGNVCSNVAEGSKDGGIDAAGKIQKRPDDFLEAVFFGC